MFQPALPRRTREFEKQLALLERDGQDKRFEGIRADAGTVIRNLESIEEGMLERFELADRADALRLELVTIRADLDEISGSRPWMISFSTR